MPLRRLCYNEFRLFSKGMLENVSSCAMQSFLILQIYCLKGAWSFNVINLVEQNKQVIFSVKLRKEKTSKFRSKLMKMCK